MITLSKSTPNISYLRFGYNQAARREELDTLKEILDGATDEAWDFCEGLPNHPDQSQMRSAINRVDHAIQEAQRVLSDCLTPSNKTASPTLSLVG